MTLTLFDGVYSVNARQWLACWPGPRQTGPQLNATLDGLKDPRSHMAHNPCVTPKELFFREVWTWIRSESLYPWLDESVDPVTGFERMRALRPGSAEAGLREAVSDLVEMTRELSDRQVTSLETHLRQQGAPSLASVRLDSRRGLLNLLNRGRIRTNEEYRAVLERLNDVDDPAFDTAARAAANRMVQEYEPPGDE